MEVIQTVSEVKNRIEVLALAEFAEVLDPGQHDRVLVHTSVEPSVSQEVLIGH